METSVATTKARITKDVYERRHAKAIENLRRAVEVSQRDHHREDGSIWFDFGAMESAVQMALEALEPDAKE